MLKEEERRSTFECTRLSLEIDDMMEKKEDLLYQET